MSQPNPSSNPPAQPEMAAQAENTLRQSFVWRVLTSREFSVFVVLIILCILMVFTSARSTFFTPMNAGNILRNVALLSIFAIGETIVIITGGIDLSLGSLIAFTGMLMAAVITRLENGPLLNGVVVMIGIIVTLGASSGLGAIHATLIHHLKLPPFVVTLASLMILRSWALLMHHQLPIPITNFPWLSHLANGNLFEGSVFPVPMPVVILAFVAILTWLALSKLRIGRYLYSVGSNEQATELSGVNVYKVKLFAYGVSGLLGGLAGVLWASYGGQGDPQAGQAYELEAVAASVVGGANLMGGQGSVVGTLLGATLLYVIFSAINLTLSSPDLWRGSVVGSVLLFAVLVNALRGKDRKTIALTVGLILVFIRLIVWLGRLIAQ